MLKVFLGLVAIIGLGLSIQSKSRWVIAITSGIVLGILMVFYPSALIPVNGFYIYLAFVALAFIYGILVKGKPTPERIIIWLMSGCIGTYWFWVLNHLHGNELLLPLLALLAGIYGLVIRAKLKNELGFLVILAADAIAIILQHWLKIV